MKRNRWLVLVILAGTLVFTSACGIVNTLLGSSTSAGTVSELWADVPRFEPMTKANLEMPLAARLAIQAVTQGKINFIAYTTERTPQEVQDFYTQARMSDAGWNAGDTTGCMGDSGTESVGAICMFGREDGSNKELLAVVVAREDGTQQTQVFFARIDTTAEQVQ